MNKKLFTEAILFIPMFGAGLVMLKKNPNLLRSRLDAQEKEKDQQDVVKLSGLMLLLGFILAGLDFRFGWSRLPAWVPVSASVLFLLAYPAIIIKRLRNEEEVLLKELPGYEEYTKKVKYRLLPFIW